MRHWGFLLVCALLLVGQGALAQEVDAEGGLVIEPVKRVDEGDTAPEAPAAADGEAQGPEAPIMVRSVVLRAINKITARNQLIESKIGIIARFGNLEILARDCWKAPDTERPENAALLDIWERKLDERPQRIFLGWMFSSSPSVSLIEHALYDITVVECKSTPMGADGE